MKGFLLQYLQILVCLLVIYVSCLVGVTVSEKHRYQRAIKQHYPKTIPYPPYEIIRTLQMKTKNLKSNVKYVFLLFSVVYLVKVFDYWCMTL